jgi:hypothetical protein
MSKFIELHPPKRDDNRGSINFAKWYVAAYATVGGFLCNTVINDKAYIGYATRGNVNKQTNRNSVFYFDSERAAHTFAASYYMEHGVMYPYIDEWQRSQVECDGMSETTSQQRVMDFI